MRTLCALIFLCISPALLLAYDIPDGTDFPTRRSNNAIKAEYVFHGELVRTQYYWWENGYLWVEDIPTDSQFADILAECGFNTEQNGLSCGGYHQIYSPYHGGQRYCSQVNARTIFFIALNVSGGCNLNLSNKFYLINLQWSSVNPLDVLKVFIPGNPNHAYRDDDDDDDDDDQDTGGGGGGCFVRTLLGIE